MNLAIYILTGTLFMFSIEYFTTTKSFKKFIKKTNTKTSKIQFNAWSRTVGIVFWPICLVVFLYSFFKHLFKLNK